MLSTSVDNSVLSPMLNDEGVNASKFLTQYEEAMDPVLNGVGGSRVGCATTVGGLWTSILTIKALIFAILTSNLAIKDNTVTATDQQLASTL